MGTNLKHCPNIDSENEILFSDVGNIPRTNVSTISETLSRQLRTHRNKW